MPAYRRVGILYNPRIREGAALAERLREVAARAGAEAWSCATTEPERVGAQLAGTSLVVSVGGDGTILRAVRAAVGMDIPVLGVNVGKLGFLAEVRGEQGEQALAGLLQDGGWHDERTMLEAEVWPAGSASWEMLGHALNDVVVGRGLAARAVTLHVLLDGEALVTYKADALVVATATGSTAYSLAAGGPVLYPGATDLLLKPVAPHLCPTPALVLPADSVLDVQVHSDHGGVVSVDGQIERPLANEDRVRVRRSPHKARLLRTTPREKLYPRVMQRLS